MKKRLKYFGTMLLCSMFLTTAFARDIYVSKSGKDGNAGTSAAPYLTINKAAQVAVAGDTVWVREGVYREWVSPKNTGTAAKRIIYKSVPGDDVVIKGSEVINGWTKNAKYGNNVWSVTIDDSFFGSFNPYRKDVGFRNGDFITSGGWHSPGAVYYNGDCFSEVKIGSIGANAKSWAIVTGSGKVTLVANFGTINPSSGTVEINAREAAFTPASSMKVHNVTVSGFTMMHAATGWCSPYSGTQIGLIGPHAGKNWIIENNNISDSRCVGVSIGRGNGTQDNISHGGHIIRNNKIERCGEAGIFGTRANNNTLIEGNIIRDTNWLQEVSGWEVAGIKLHFSTDVTIKDNLFDNVYAGGSNYGIWMDFENQGTRITGNIFKGQMRFIARLEKNIGPIIIDNNIILNGKGIQCNSRNVIVAFNGGSDTAIKADSVVHDADYFKPHTRTVAGSTTIFPSHIKYFGNLLKGSNLAILNNYADCVVDYNALYTGSRLPSTGVGSHNLISNENATFSGNLITIKGKEYCEVTVNAPASLFDIEVPLITPDYVGEFAFVPQGFEDPNGDPIQLSTDIMGVVNTTRIPGPFSDLKQGVNTYLIPLATGANTETRKEPKAKITSPENGTQYLIGNTISLRGTASDIQDGTLGNAAMVWSSDIDGKIGTGTAVNINSLSAGKHRITLTAKDSAGLTEINEIIVTVNETQLPSYRLTVNSGSGDGSYKAGKRVSIKAANPVSGMMFDKWVGDVEDIVNVLDSDTSFIMAAEKVSVTATYKSAPISFKPTHDVFFQGTSVINDKNLKIEAGYREAFMKFNVKNSSNKFKSAILKMEVGPDSGKGTIRVYNGSHTSWTEGTIKNSNKPKAVSDLASFTGTFANTISYDLTDFFQKNGNGEYTLILKMDSGSKHDVWFQSSEASVPPRLEVYYENNATTYTLNVANGSGDGSYQAGKLVGISADSAPEGQEFDKWTGNVANVADVTKATTTITMPGSAAAITARYKLIPVTKYKVTINSGSGDGSYISGAEVTISANAAPAGKMFNKWIGDVANVANVNSATTTLTVAKTATAVSATYKDIPVTKYKVTVNSGAGDGSYISGAEVAISANAAPAGKMFNKWIGDIANVANVNSATTTLTVAKVAVAVTATYKDIPKFKLSVGSGSGDGSYEAGEEVTITADEAPEGQVFDKWVGNVADVNSESTTLIMPSKALTITALYKDDTGTEVTILEDAYLEKNARKNDEYLKVEAGNRVSYLKIDVTDADKIESAILNLTVNGDPGQGTIRLFAGSHSDWTEDNLSTNNAPSKGIELASADQQFSEGSTHKFDITKLLTEDGPHTVILEMDAGGNDVWFSSTEGSKEPVVEVSLKPAEDFTGLYINAGGSESGNFVADKNFVEGSTYSTSEAIDTSKVGNADQTLYQSERYGDFSYGIDELEAGKTYTVRLHFAEIYLSQAGKRLFSVHANEKALLENFDVFTEAGGKNIAITREFSIEADEDGFIALHFTSLKDSAKVSAIEVSATSLLKVVSIGNLSQPAAIIKTGSIYSLGAAGNDIWGRNDNFGYAQTQLVGDGEITVQVLSVENINAWTKAGIMIRETLQSDSPHAMIVATPSRGVAFQSRATVAGGSTNKGVGGIKVPVWLKLNRKGDLFTAYYSADGETWQQVGTPRTIEMTEIVHIGLCLTSHNADTIAIAEFDKLTVDK